MRRFQFEVAIALVCAAPGALAGVLRVAPANALFTDIQTAVSTALDGDTILVAPSTYPGFTITDKALTVGVDPQGSVACGAVIVENVSSARNVVLSGLTVDATNGHALTIRACTGSVRLLGCSMRGSAAMPAVPSLHAPGSGVYVTGSNDVVFVQCAVDGGRGLDGQSSRSPGADALFARGSRFALYQCALTGGAGGNAGSDTSDKGGAGGDALQSPNAFVLAQRTMFQGGSGGAGGDGNSTTLAGDGGSGGAGIRLTADTLTTAPEVVTRNCTLNGGDGGPGGFSGGNQGRHGPSTFVSTGVVHDPLLLDELRCSTPVIWPVGSARVITIQGTPGASVALYAARDTGFVYDTGTQYALHLSSPLIRRLELGSIPASGTLTWNLVVPPIAGGGASETWYLQSVVFEPSASVLSSPAAVVVIAPGM